MLKCSRLCNLEVASCNKLFVMFGSHFSSMLKEGSSSSMLEHNEAPILISVIDEHKDICLTLFCRDISKKSY